MSIYQKLSVLLTFLALCAALYVGIEQNSINTDLLNLNYQPSLAVNYSQPQHKLENGLSIINNGKSSIFFYESAFITDSNPESNIVVDNNDPNVIAPGATIYEFGDDVVPLLLLKMGTSTDRTFPLDIFFKTQDQTKYIFRTNLRLAFNNKEWNVYWGPESYAVYNWPEK